MNFTQHERIWWTSGGFLFWVNLRSEELATKKPAKGHQMLVHSALCTKIWWTFAGFFVASSSDLRLTHNKKPPEVHQILSCYTHVYTVFTQFILNFLLEWTLVTPHNGQNERMECKHRCNLRGYEGYWYPHFLDGQVQHPSLFRTKRWRIYCYLLSAEAICGD